MRSVFVDTAGWASFFIQTERFHDNAVQQMHEWRKANVKVVTTNYVLSELVALFTSPLRLPRTQLISTIETIKNTAWIEIVHIDAVLDGAAWDLLKQRQDKNWSLVDCSSMVVMQHHGIQQVLTTDHHFRQAGYEKLLG